VGSVVYALCALTSLVCAVLLLSQYRKHRDRILLWSGLCFSGLTLNSLLLFADYVLVPGVDLALYRSATAAASMLLLLMGLIREGG
jgi:hypothetical protein